MSLGRAAQGKHSATEQGGAPLPTVQGIELSRRFYAEVVAPWLGREFPGLITPRR